MLCLSSYAYADSLPIAKVIGRNVIHPKSKALSVGDKVRIISSTTKKTDAIAQVKECRVTRCRSVILKKRKKSKITRKHYILIKPAKKLVRSSKKEIKHNDSSRQPINSRWDEKNSLTSLSVGGPTSFGIRASYVQPLFHEWRFGGSIGQISQTIGNVKISAMELSLRADYYLTHFDFGELDSFIMTEIGLISGEVDFSSVDANGPVADVSVPYGAISWGLETNLGGDFGLFGKLGYAYNTFKSSYTNDNGDAYTTPFDGGLILVELGFTYLF